HRHRLTRFLYMAAPVTEKKGGCPRNTRSILKSSYSLHSDARSHAPGMGTRAWSAELRIPWVAPPFWLTDRPDGRSILLRGNEPCETSFGNSCCWASCCSAPRRGLRRD